MIAEIQSSLSHSPFSLFLSQILRPIKKKIPPSQQFFAHRIYSSNLQSATSSISSWWVLTDSLESCKATMSFDEGSRSPSSQVPLYLWGGSKVYKKRFVSNMHHITTEAHLQKWHDTYVAPIPDGVGWRCF